MLVGHRHILFGGMFAPVLCLFFNGVTVFSLLSWKSSLYTLDIRPLSDTGFANTFSHFGGRLLTFWTMCSKAQKSIILTKAKQPILLLWLLAVRCASKRPSPNLRRQRLTPMSPCKSFIGLTLTFRSLVHLVYIRGFNWSPVSFFCLLISRAPQNHLLKG